MDLKYKTFQNGSTWLRADFHLHTKKDNEFVYNGQENDFISLYINKLVENKINIGVITNHNKFDLKEFMSLYKDAKKEDIFLLPGVELSVNDGASGIHTIVVFSDEWIENGKDYINQFLNVTFQGKTPDEYENGNGRSQDNILETIKKLNEYNKEYFLIFAHVEQTSGLWNELKGGRIGELGKSEIFKERTLGFQKVRTRDSANSERKDRPCRKKVIGWLNNWYPAEVEGSDCKSIDEVGNTEECYLKIGDFSFEAVKFALIDHNNRVSSILPKHTRSYIKSVHFDSDCLQNKDIYFSPELNTLIGIRGSGKSAIIESLRFVLDIPFGEKAQDYDYKKKLIRHTLGSAGKITMTAVDRFGHEYQIRRIYDQLPEVLENEVLQPGISIKETIIYKPIYFGQKDLSSSGEGFETDLIEKLLGDKVSDVRIKIEEQKNKVIEAIRRYINLKNVDEKLKDFSDKKADIEFRLQKYKEYKIEEKLQKQIDFDADYKKSNQVTTLSKSYIIALEEILSQYEDDLKNLLSYNSKYNKSFFDNFFKTYSKLLALVESLKTNIEQSKAVLNDLNNQEVEFIKIKDNLKEEFANVERELSLALKSSGVTVIKPDEYKELSKNLDYTNSMLEELKKSYAKGNQIKNDLISELSKLDELWREEFILIKNELDTVNLSNSSLKIVNEFKGDNEAYLRVLKENFKGSNIREASLQKIANDFKDFHVIFNSFDKVKDVISNVWQTFEEYFNNSLNIFLTWQKPNKVSIEYCGKPLREHSLGQRASALILFVLSQKENDVIIIDQPEDDLDNQTIYNDVIKLIKKIKPETQFILATHNPNIPVLGDAEQVISCKYTNEIIELSQGSIDSAFMQNEIVNIMEGGEEAFNKRKEIYKIWKQQNS